MTQPKSKDVESCQCNLGGHILRDFTIFYSVHAKSNEGYNRSPRWKHSLVVIFDFSSNYATRKEI